MGGDYYDFLALPDGRHGCVLADVAGKGMPAALVMMNLQARVQVLSETQFEPAAFMTTLDRVMQKTCPDDRFITVFYCAVDPAGGHLRYANAGHNPPVLVRADGTVEWLREGGPVLGVLPQVYFGASDARLTEGRHARSSTVTVSRKRRTHRMRNSEKNGSRRPSSRTVPARRRRWWPPSRPVSPSGAETRR